jgi:tetratricopeptide (TPR) repeat protein
MKDVPAGFVATRKLGEGAMGVVWAATHTATGAEVALKVVRPTSRRASLAVENEVAAMARVNHPSLLYLYDWGLLDDGAVWMALEAASGGSLEGWMPRSWGDVVEVCRPLLAGLAHAHAVGLVHRDLKPENVLVCLPTDRRPGLKIADFGLAHAIASGRASRGGTPFYIPPEQFDPSFGDAGPWSDLYTLGAVLWHWITGEPVFSEGSPVATASAHAVRALPPFVPRFGLPPEAEGVIHALLEKEPSDRPQRIADLGALLPDLAPSTAAVADRTPAAPLPGLGLGLIGQRELPLTGREDLQRTLVTALQHVRRTGAPLVLVLVGQPGVGREHLVRWLMVWAEETGLAQVERDPRQLLRRFAPSGAFDRHRTRIVRGGTSLDAELAFADAPLLIVRIADHEDDAPELEGLPEVRTVEVPALSPGALRHVLRAELGLHPDAVLQLGELVGGSPGRAVRWMEELAAADRLRATAQGVEIRGPLGRAPLPDDRLGLLQGALAGLDPETVLQLRLGALLGTDVLTEEWTGLLTLFGLRPRPSGVRALVRAGLATRTPSGWTWRDDGARQTAMHALPRLASYHEAAAAVLATFPDTDGRLLRRGEHLLGAGRVTEGLSALVDLVRLDPDMELQRRAVVAVRPYLGATDAEQHLAFATAEARVVMNLLSAADAVPYAEQMLRCVDEVAHDAVAERQLAAAVFTHAGRTSAAHALLDELPENARTLRLRGLLHSDNGDYPQAAEVLERALAMADDDRIRSRIANSMGTLASRTGRLEEALRRYRLAADTIESFVRYVPMGNLAIVLLLLDRPVEALQCAVEARDGARGHGPRRSGYGAAVCAFAASLAGDVDTLASVRQQAMHTLHTYPLDDLDTFLRLAERTGDLPRAAADFLSEARVALMSRRTGRP